MPYTVILKSLLNFLKRMLFLYFRKQKPLKIVIYFPKRKHFLYLRTRRKNLRKNYLYSRKQKPLKIVIYFPKRKHFLYLRKRRKNLRKNYLYSRKQLSEHEKIKATHYQRSFFYFRKLNLFAKSLKISFFRRIRYPYDFLSLFTVFSGVFTFCHWFLQLFFECFIVDCVFPCHQLCCFFCQVHRALFLHCITSVKELSVRFLL